MMENLLSAVIKQGDIVFFSFVFLSVVLATIVVANLTATWFGIRRRAVAGGELATATLGSGADTNLFAGGERPGYFDGLLPSNETDKSELRKFLNLAGYYGRGAPAVYQLVRAGMGLWFGMMTSLLYGRFFPTHPFFLVIAAGLGMTLLGYYLPKSIVSLKRDGLCEEHRQGFPDFLDLLIICIEAGIGIDSAIERVSNDLSRGYPSLARNLKFMILELRAGRSTRDGLDNLAARIGGAVLQMILLHRETE